MLGSLQASNKRAQRPPSPYPGEISMRIISRSLALVALMGSTLMLGESVASAQGYYGPAYGPPAPPPPQRGYYAAPRQAYYGYGHSHDGFFLRVTAGLGYVSASETYGGATDTYSGVGATFGAAFGGVIAPNLILFGEFLGTTVTDPHYDISGPNGGSGSMSGDMTLFGIGPGIAYYIEPINLYLSGTLAFSETSFTDNYYGTSDSTNWGLGASFAVGKEWWVGRDLGIGLAGQIHLASMSDNVQGYDTRLTATAFSLLFSATYN
jgi:hypothetical protein